MEHWVYFQSPLGYMRLLAFHAWRLWISDLKEKIKKKQEVCFAG